MANHTTLSCIRGCNQGLPNLSWLRKSLLPQRCYDFWVGKEVKEGGGSLSESCSITGGLAYECGRHSAGSRTRTGRRRRNSSLPPSFSPRLATQGVFAVKKPGEKSGYLLSGGWRGVGCCCCCCCKERPPWRQGCSKDPYAVICQLSEGSGGRVEGGHRPLRRRLRLPWVIKGGD